MMFRILHPVRICELGNPLEFQYYTVDPLNGDGSATGRLANVSAIRH